MDKPQQHSDALITNYTQGFNQWPLAYSSASNGTICSVCLSRRSGGVDLSQGRSQVYHRTSDPQALRENRPAFTPAQAQISWRHSIRFSLGIRLVYPQGSIGGLGLLERFGAAP
jgi:hypothetical protein